MSIYLYEAYDKDRNIKKGKIEKNNAEDVVSYLRTKNLSAIHIKKLNILNTDISDLKIFYRRQKLKARDISFFCRQMTFIIESGLSISEGLTVIERECSSKLLKEEIMSIRESVLAGESFTQSIKKSGNFPDFLCDMIKIGERSGRVGEVMNRLATHYEKEVSVRGKVLNAIVYPLFIMSVTTAVTIMVLVMLIPNYEMMFLSQGVTLPMPTRILIWLSNFIINFYLGIITFIILLCMAIYYANKNVTVKAYRDKFLLKVPVLKNVLRMFFCLRFSQAMALMTESGVSILEATRMTKDLIKNFEAKKALSEICEGLEEGQNLVTNMKESTLFHGILISMVEVGEVTGNVSASLKKSEEYFDEQINLTAKRVEKLIEPSLILILGFVVAFIMLSITLPTFYLASNI